MSESSRAGERVPRNPADAVDDLEDVYPDDVYPDDSADGDDRRRRARSSRRRSWRRGGSSVRRWGWELFGWAVLALGIGVIASSAASTVIGGALGAAISTGVLWLAFAVPVVLAFLRSRPRGLLVFRPVDVLYAVVLGGVLRIAQGWLDVAAGARGAWPSYPSLGGSLPGDWFTDQLLGSVLVAPVLEEFFFRGLVVVAVFTAVRRIAGSGVATFAAVVVSTALFVVTHVLLAPVSWGNVAALALVAIVTSLLVVLTGRLWAAVLTHVVYNASWVALATIGTLLAG